MIPKIIHLCWFGTGKYPPLVEYCINSWKEKLPDYKIMLWNEKSFDVNSTLWTKQAYEKKKWAFVCDYVRLYALKKIGGIYLDTDVEVLNDFTELIQNDSFALSFIEGCLVSMGFIACEAGSKHLDELLHYYETNEFVNSDGTINDESNNLIFTRMIIDKYGLKFGAKSFDKNGFHIYPMELFMPYKKNFFMKRTNKKSYKLTRRTFTIHHDLGSWDDESQITKVIKYLIRLVLPSKLYMFLKKKKFEKRI